MVSEERFLEWANVHGHFYGTRKDVVEDILNSGRDVVLEIDVQGASQVKKKMPEAVMIFIQPPSFEELVRRLRKRGTEGPEEFELRILNAKEEMSHAGEYEHMIINDRVDKAAEDLIKIVKQYREFNMIYMDLEKIYRNGTYPISTYSHWSYPHAPASSARGREQ